MTLKPFRTRTVAAHEPTGLAILRKSEEGIVYEAVVRSNSGTYHLGTLSTRRCNHSGNVRHAGNRYATVAEFRAASESSLCRKCFAHTTQAVVLNRVINDKEA